jgi:hypothetical protein
MHFKTQLLSWSLLVVTFGGIAIGKQQDLSPNGKLAIDGAYSDLYLINTATGGKLAPLFPPSQQGQLSNVALDVRWAPDSQSVVIIASYGTRMNEVLIFSFGSGRAKAVKINSPDFSKYARAKPDDNLISYDENVVGAWSGRNKIDLLLGTAENVSDKTTHYFQPARFSRRAGTPEISYGRIQCLSDKDYASYLKANHFSD